MERLTRKELKEEIVPQQQLKHGVEYLGEHRRQAVMYGGIAIGLAVIIASVVWYRGTQHEARQQELHAAMKILSANVGPNASSDSVMFFPSNGEKEVAVKNAFTNIVSKHSGTDEATIARYFLATSAADNGNLAEAEKDFKEVSEGGEANYGSLAKLALAQIYASQGKVADGEKLLRSVMDKPTIFVSKDEATIALARLLSATNPSEARKLLEPLKTARSAISRAALTALSEVPQSR